MREATRRLSDERLRREKIERKNLYLDPVNNKMVCARAFEFISLFGKRRRYDLFVFERYVEGYRIPVEVYIKNGRVGAEIMFSQEPAAEEGKNLLNAQFQDRFRDMKNDSQSFKAFTKGWVNEREYELAISQLDSPFEELLKNIAR